MNKELNLKTIIFLILPIILFAVLVVPYSYLNSEYIVDIFGCGCPKIDEFGNIIENDINANDITAVFWACVALCSTVIGGFISVKLPKIWMRILYTFAVFAVSLTIAYNLTQSMMWN
ncbi:MAG: hypothetical protein E7672_00285 [Ruminococcaceae bacterium]|nr:hypothetical protein [Oscillospiraceae bacterium]